MRDNPCELEQALDPLAAGDQRERAAVALGAQRPAGEQPQPGRIHEVQAAKVDHRCDLYALGLVGASWLGRAGSAVLFGVTASDPLTFTTVSLLLTGVAVAASYVPARRAMTVDPIVALRVT